MSELAVAEMVQYACALMQPSMDSTSVVQLYRCCIIDAICIGLCSNVVLFW